MPDTNKLIVVDEKLLAHANNDPFLTGSYKVEGNTFDRTIGLLNQYVNQLSQDNISEDVKSLLQASNGLVGYQAGIDNIRQSFRQAREERYSGNFDDGMDTQAKYNDKISQASQLLPELAEKIHSDIQNLKDDDYLLVPGGWAAPKGGHAIIYQYSLDKAGNLLFSINNSGSGLQFHEKKSVQEKELYNPVLTYKIPKDKINGKNLTRFIQATLKLQTPDLHKIDEIKPEYLYQRVFPLLAYVKGDVVQSESIASDHWYTGGQLSGTCAQRSLHQMLKARFSSLDEYRRFIYGFKVYVLDEYLAQSGVLSDPKQTDLIEQAIKHNLRLLNLEQSEHLGQSLFSQHEKTAGHEKLLGYLSQLKRLKPTPIDEVNIATPAPNASRPLTDYQFSHVLPEKPQFGDVINNARDDITTPLVLTTGQPLLDHMDDILKLCGSLGVMQDHAMLEQLESFFLTLALPEKTLADPLHEAYSAIDSDAKALEFYQKMNQLQTLYFDTCHRLLGTGVLLPRMYLVKVSAFSAISHVNLNRPMTDDKLSYYPFVQNMLSLLYQNPDQTLIANNDPQCDERYKHICGLALSSRRNFSPPGNSLDAALYYRSLLDNAVAGTELKAKLEIQYLEQYGEDNSTLHTQLRKNQCTALYYFLEHIETLTLDAECKPLIDRFQLQLDMEKAYTYASGIFSSPYPVYKEQQIKLGLTSYDKTLCVEESPAEKNYRPLELPQSLRENKYGWKTSSVAYAQDFDNKQSGRNKRTDNNTQLLPGDSAGADMSYFSPEQKALLAQRQINDSDLEERELFHLRKDSTSQIRLTMDYFNGHLEKCIDADMQRYIEANFFQPGLLLAELSPKQATSFFKQFDALITNGLALYEKKGQLSQHSLFFIRLAFQVNQYAALHDPAQQGARLESFYQHVNCCLETTDDKAIKASLHQYRFLTAVTQMKLNPQNTTHLNDALLSYFQSQVLRNAKEPTDTDSQFKLDCAKHDMKRFLSQHQDSITSQQVLMIVSQLGISMQEPLHVTGHYPTYTVLDKDHVTMMIDLEQGKVFKDGMAYSRTPPAILGHPVMKQLGLEGLDSCFVSADGKTCLMNKPPVSLRFLDANAGYHIQKKWIDHAGKEAWFQLTALTPEQEKILQVEQSVLPIAKTIKERDSMTWIHCDTGELLITDASHKPWYRGIKNDENNDWQLTDVQKQATLCAQNTWIHQRLSALESPDFITVAKKDDHYIATLPRYGLNYSVDGQSGAIHMDWEGGTYRLQEASPLSKGIAHLTLSNDKQAICILPVQRFMNMKERATNSVYYRLAQDTQGVIPSNIVEKIFGDKNDGPKTPQLWQYTGSEQCLVLKMVNNEPVPQNSAEALYLCYVYLGNNQPEKAWAVLEDCDKRLGGLAGTYDEVRYLSWIVNALPIQLNREDKEAVISNPLFVPCKLKALALLAGFSRQDKVITFPESTQDERTVNGLYERAMIKNVEAFYKTVNKPIYELYTRMQGMRREMPVNFTLSDVACKQLLDLYQGQNKAVGALGYEWVKYHLVILHQEHALLVAKELTGTATSFDKQRKQDIDAFIEHHDGVAKNRSELEYPAINLSLPKGVRLNTSVLPYDIQVKTTNKMGIFSSLVEDKSQQQMAIDGLRSDISDTIFFTAFNDYLMIATTPGNPHRDRLLEFCQDTLIANRHVPIDEQISNVPLLCHVLYRVLSSGLPLPKQVVSQYGQYSDLLDYAKTLPAPDITIPQLVDNTRDLLTTATAMWEAIPTVSQMVIPVVLNDELEIASFQKTFSGSLKGIKQQWDDMELRFRKGDPAHVQSERETSLLTSEEYIFGDVKYQALLNLKSIANQLDERIINDLAPQTKQSLIELNLNQETLTQTILDLAKLGPDDLA